MKNTVNHLKPDSPAFKNTRGDAALWILTKMAMVFFIIALALILTTMGNAERSSLCSANAQKVADELADAFNLALNSPLENERMVIKLEPYLAAGEGTTARYHVNFSKREVSGGSLNSLIITVSSDFDARCSGGRSVAYPKNFDNAATKQFFLMPATSASDRQWTGSRTAPKIFETITLRPNPRVTAASARTRYAVVMMCKEKVTAARKFLFVQDCTDDKPEMCLGFDTPTTLTGTTTAASVCGFG